MRIIAIEPEKNFLRLDERGIRQMWVQALPSGSLLTQKGKYPVKNAEHFPLYFPQKTAHFNYLCPYILRFILFTTSAIVNFFISSSIALWIHTSLSSKAVWMFLPTGQHGFGFSWKWNSVPSSNRSTASYTS